MFLKYFCISEWRICIYAHFKSYKSPSHSNVSHLKFRFQNTSHLFRIPDVSSYYYSTHLFFFIISLRIFAFYYYVFLFPHFRNRITIIMINISFLDKSHKYILGFNPEKIEVRKILLKIKCKLKDSNRTNHHIQPAYLLHK